MELNIKVEKLQYLQLGREGENEALTVNIDMTSWVNEHPDISLACFVIMQKPGEQNGYPKTTTWDSHTNILTWNVSTDATSEQGTGYIEVRAIDSQAEPDHETDSYSGFVKKSKMIPVLIDNSVSHLTGTAVPTAYNDFLNQVLKTVSDLNDIFEEAHTMYQVSTSAAAVPTGEWLEQDELTPTVMAGAKGKFLWSRTEFAWSTGPSTFVYSISYIGNDTTGAVTSVNGETGEVLMDGKSLDVDIDAETPEKIADAIADIRESIGGIESSGFVVKTTTIDATRAGLFKDTSTATNPVDIYRGYYEVTLTALSPDYIISAVIADANVEQLWQSGSGLITVHRFICGAPVVTGTDSAVIRVPFIAVARKNSEYPAGSSNLTTLRVRITYRQSIT